MFSTLLVPVDGSTAAKRAAKFGLELAAKYDASVDLLYVVEEGILTDDSHEARKKERGTAVLEEMTELDIDGAPSVETHLVVGNPSEAITDHVTDRDIDLVVMGRHGRTGVRERILGNVAERVLRSVEVPVLTVPDDGLRSETGRAYENVLLTTDGSEVAERAAPYGVDVARRTGATLHLLTVVDAAAEAGPFDAGGLSQEHLERLESEGEEALDRLIERIDETGVDLRPSLVTGRTASEIDGYAAENDIDLLVMASRGQTGLVGQYLGSTTRRILETVHRPVLVVPATD